MATTLACGSGEGETPAAPAPGGTSGGASAAGGSATAGAGGFPSAGGEGARSGMGEPRGTGSAATHGDGGSALGGSPGSGGFASGGATHTGGLMHGAGMSGLGGMSAGGVGAGGVGAGGVGTGGVGTGGVGTGGVGGMPEFDHGLLGVYTGNSPSEITQFENWLGRPVDGILGYTGDASWEDYDGSVGWAVGVWKALDRRVLWSVPLIPTGASLEEAAAGSYDDHYRKAAETLADYRPQDSVLYIRTGWEFNGDWFPWTAHNGKANAFAGAFQRFVTVFRSVSPRFRFEWNVNVGDVGMNPETAYPGDDYVDIIGMDFYWNTQWDPNEPVAAWDYMLNRSYGLEWHQAFAAAHGKPTAYSEWGVMADDAAYYIEQAAAWFDTHDVVYQTYWDANNAFRGKLSNGQYPSTAAAYRAQFR